MNPLALDHYPQEEEIAPVDVLEARVKTEEDDDEEEGTRGRKKSLVFRENVHYQGGGRQNFKLCPENPLLLKLFWGVGQSFEDMSPIKALYIFTSSLIAHLIFPSLYSVYSTR